MFAENSAGCVRRGTKVRRLRGRRFKALGTQPEQRDALSLFHRSTYGTHHGRRNQCASRTLMSPIIMIWGSLKSDSPLPLRCRHHGHGDLGPPFSIGGLGPAAGVLLRAVEARPTDSSLPKWRRPPDSRHVSLLTISEPPRFARLGTAEPRPRTKRAHGPRVMPAKLSLFPSEPAQPILPRFQVAPVSRSSPKHRNSAPLVGSLAMGSTTRRLRHRDSYLVLSLGRDTGSPPGDERFQSPDG